jgi:pimeloyl-CoA synthetase
MCWREKADQFFGYLLKIKMGYEKIIRPKEVAMENTSDLSR